MNLLNGLLKNLVVWVLPRPRFILAAALLSVLVSIWIAAERLEVQTDPLSLISTRHPLIAKSHMLDQLIFTPQPRSLSLFEAPPRTAHGVHERHSDKNPR